MYNGEGMYQWQIAKEFDVNDRVVCTWFSNYGIKVTVSKIPPKEVLERMYLDEGMTQKQIASEFGVVRTAVEGWICKYGIPTVGRQGSLVPIPPKDDLLNYIDDGLNQLQIAEEYKVSDWKIYDWCEKLGIPGMVNSYRCTTPEHIEWRDAVFERDHYTCQKCGATNTIMHPHHIVPFADHPEVAYELDNGITLCEGCHYTVTGHEYDYIQQFAAITQPHLRDHEVIESMPWEAPLPPLSDKLFPDYSQEMIA
jgi:transposase/ribosomal protein L37AE/L43A